MGSIASTMTRSILLLSIAILCSIQTSSGGTEYGQKKQQGHAGSANLQQTKTSGSIRLVSIINRLYRKQKKEVTKQKTRRSKISVAKLRRLHGKQMKEVKKL